LLDWLAVEFVERGWDVKHMVKLIVMSGTYRQSSSAEFGVRNAELSNIPPSEHSALRTPHSIDPDNRLFARQSRWRLPAEFVRDNALAISGLLVRDIGGESARPYQPDGYYAPLNFPKRTYKSDTDENQYRRGVYVHWQRQYLHPMLKAFDAPSREECTAQRPRSNTPLQSLTLLNDPTFIECARVFATRIIQEGGSDENDRIRWAWKQALSREPDEHETAVLTRFYHQSRNNYEGSPDAAAKLIEVGLAPPPENADPVELAAWTEVARAILNLNETITRN
ncbi:MAG: DUF1553 domain-containing protein, partial [Planctomycetaceae bacterium]